MERNEAEYLRSELASIAAVLDDMRSEMRGQRRSFQTLAEYLQIACEHLGGCAGALGDIAAQLAKKGAADV